MTTIIISPNLPISLTQLSLRHYIDMTCDAKDICEFFNHYMKCSLFDPNIIIKLRMLNSVIYCLKCIDTGKILAAMIVNMIPIQIKNRFTNASILHGHTSTICVHKSYRKKGIGTRIIDNAIKWGHSNNILCGYHLSFKKLSPNGFVLHQFECSLKYEVTEPSGIRFEKITEPKASEYYWFIPQMVDYYPFAFSPNTPEYFISWCNTFDTYLIFDNNLVIGIISLKTNETSIDLVWCSGKQPHTLQMALYICKHKYPPYFLKFRGYEMGLVSPNVIERINGTRTSTIRYFELYNNSLKLKPTDLCIPIF